MWLLNARTYRLESFEGEDTPNYAILSHRWEEDEPTFSDVKKGRQWNTKGWNKVIHCCKQALLDQLDYIWADTCCIDKKSSAELSEAINSMFRWYQNADRCYVYLSDITGANNITKSVWFTRGWTLQELLAPRQLFFFDQAWKMLCSRIDLQYEISDRTGIPTSALYDFDPTDTNTLCVAQKMSWAADRQTTRIEDRAYSLLGLFHVNMPLLYGEGREAFTRLQQELMKTSDDLSLFAWECSPNISLSLLAAQPDDFANLAAIAGSSSEYEVTKYNITFSGNLWHHKGDIFMLIVGHDRQNLWTYVIFLTPIPTRSDVFTRTAIDGVTLKRVCSEYFPSTQYVQNYRNIRFGILQRQMNPVGIASLLEFRQLFNSDVFTLPIKPNTFRVAVLNYDHSKTPLIQAATFTLTIHAAESFSKQRLYGCSNYQEAPCLLLNESRILQFGLNLLDGQPTILISQIDSSLRHINLKPVKKENELKLDFRLDKKFFNEWNPVKVVEIEDFGSFSFHKSSSEVFNRSLHHNSESVLVAVLHLKPLWELQTCKHQAALTQLPTIFGRHLKVSANSQISSPS